MPQRNLLARPDPLIVLGNQRSGTTAIAALLGRISGRPVMLDVERIHRVHAGELTLAEFVRRNRYSFSRPILKEPCLTFLVDELEALFPGACYAMVLRDPRDNIRSILNRLGLKGDAETLDPAVFERIPRAWQFVVDGAWMGLKGDNHVAMLAQRWAAAAETYLTRAESMAPVRYEDFSQDKAGTIRALAHRLGLPLRRDITSWLDRPFQPPGEREASWEHFFGPRNLRRIETICAGGMEALGYEVES